MLSLKEVMALITKELIFGFQILDLKDHFSASLRYDWSIPDKPALCVSGDNFDTDHAMICKKGDLSQ